MIVKSLLINLKHLLNDLNGMKYSMFEILQVMNIVIAVINRALAYKDSYLVKKKVPIVFTEGIADVPSDFNGLISLMNGSDEIKTQLYTFFGNQIELSANVSANTIVYKRTFDVLVDGNSDIPLPDSYSPIINKYVKAILMRELSDDKVFQAILSDISNMSSGKDYSSMERDMPFYL